MSKEKPIIFSAPMVRAVLAGTKTQTRRIAKLTPGGHVKEPRGHRRWHPGDPEAARACPYGTPGDRLWVRETWADVNSEEGPSLAYRADQMVRSWHDFSETFGPDEGAGPSMDYDAYPGNYTMWWSDLFAGEPDHSWRSPIHMPRWASRITLEVTDVRVERLQEISEEDAIAEGVDRNNDDGVVYYGPLNRGHIDPCVAYRWLWESIHGAEFWDANPWVWIVSFKAAPRDGDGGRE